MQTVTQPTFHVITTRYELDQLDGGAVVRDCDGMILVSDDMGIWLEPGASYLDPQLPALLLWHPDWAS